MNELTVEELVGNLQTFDVDHCSNKKFKCIALMSCKFGEDGSNDDSDDVKLNALFGKNLKSH